MRSAERIQLLTFAYFLVLAWVRALPRRNRLKVTAMSLAGIGVTLVSAFGLPRVLSPLAASVLRDWLPSALVLIVYWAAGAFFLRIDEKFQNTLHGLDKHFAAPLIGALARSGWIAAYLELAYLLCYPMVPMSMAALYILHLARHADYFWTVVLIPTYISYGMLPWLQALPPRMLDESWCPAAPVNPIRTLNLWLLRNASIHANTFPSAHVAASTAAALVVAALAPWPVGLLFGAIALGIALGTFFGRYHYMADALAGVLLATAVFLLV